MEKPSIPKGTRDFGPATMGKRQFIFNTIRTVYQKYGFQPLETPSMENLSVLTGKYGDEGDQLLFKVLDSGDYFEKVKSNPFKQKQIQKYADQFVYAFNLSLVGVSVIESDYLRIERILEKYKTILENIVQSYDDENDQLIFKLIINEKSLDILHKLLFSKDFDISKPLSAINDTTSNGALVLKMLNEWFIHRTTSKQLTKDIAEKGLRYDLTVPFARYVVMNRHEIAFPFKRYQMQPVWRADRPQKGRYREFYQCDADVVGTTSLLCEAEIVMMIREVMQGLGIADFTIKINHRGVLKGIADSIKAEGKETALYVAIDKLDKIGQEGVSKELTEAGFTSDNIDLLFKLLSTSGSNEEKRLALAALFNSDSGQKGLNDLKEVFNLLEEADSNQNNLEFDIALARGLSYYTGCIFEVKINNVAIGSVSGGGRYDNLTQSFGDKENLSGVGISFGVDRIYDVMEELQLFPKETQRSSTVLICHFDKESMRYSLKLLTQLRAKGIAAELYPDEAKIKKQLDYANKKMIPYVMVIGEEERNSGLLAFKNMEAGTQEKLAIEQIIGLLSK
ncbi:histidine--tRNA ligase [Chryseotalea sanaruensis]|uniref:Histidine--tRNA ligase n=1 Tax=Chryseotalea sanaruensis TaxID=2482724 RepID=A0A401U575_9BACT|nr:histidine--tRNA ligase [Chryseotalea sanaruensis]GCC49936.1 histidine--tRNA ligase [Chryseotalea sanaruensis]